ncbi:HpcH/HpaI aldolase/citrate lyase family protein [Marivivens donghaensis]|uniref:HpcH/HpaI aldolase/citrate lyase family protein n=1 Tax=Marivivens donghaensis TaxID=1699413 RepID=UPI00201E7D91|nr:CoA ester lyase [Marivivens donghaensis]MCL7409810.1 CoA ester lyase [Marivivens donghaensis]MDN3705245.1 CoA ester lyase [Marivivens donghaensis]
MTDRPFRSALYIPGSKERALEKARGLPVDAILFDLEDAVAPDEKVNARHTLKEALYQGGYGNKYRVVRINGLDTEWGKDDAAETLEMECDAVLLPKVNSTADVDALAAIIGDKKIWAMMETPLGIINAASIAAHPSIEGFVLGTNDLAKDLNTRKAERREPLLYALQAALLAAKAYGVITIDGVYNAFKDDEGLKVECEQGRDMGYDGKSLIHPAQVEITNAAFAPTEAEIELAQRQIAAFEEAEAQGLGVAVVDGKIVENLHIVTARATLAKAAAIAALDS